MRWKWKPSPYNRQKQRQIQDDRHYQRRTITHEISQKQYDKFLAVDDYHRMKLFSKIFNEVI